MGYLELNGEDWEQILNGVQTSFAFFNFVPFVEQNYPDLADNIPLSGPRKNAYYYVLDAANRRGILDQFLSTIAAERPYRPDLRQMVFYYSTKDGWSAPTYAHELNIPDALEGLTVSKDNDPFVDTSYLAQWVIKAERQVAVVRSGNEAGTGFLVGPDLLLTCYHVVAPHIKNNVGVKVRFDYRRTPGKPEPDYDAGKWIEIHPDGVLAYEPYGAADVSLEGEPAESELDFALLKLNERVGEETPTSEDKKRGWMDLSQPPPVPAINAPIYIVQHPGVDPQDRPPLQMPLKMATANPGFQGTNPNGTRLIYGTSTKKGSSGSPVFDNQLNLVALHHNRGQLLPEQKDVYENNRGIPLHKIVHALDEETRNILVAPA